jgi:lipopolysaccharide export system protein LptA
VTFNENNGSVITSDKVSFDLEKNTLEFSGNVNVKSAEIEIVQAEQVVFHNKKKIISATGFDNITVDGTIIHYGECPSTELSYKLGSGTLHINKKCNKE